MPITDIWGGNRPPTASFTVSCPTLTCSFDAGGSADPDGTITGYAWDFGDGATGTGVTTTHTYAAGQYTATLTVTDDLGATASAKQVLLVGSTQPFALDSFNRTVTGGLGQADIGGNWSTSGSGSNYSVTPGSASLVLAKASAQLAATLPGVSRTDADVSAQLSAGPAPNGGPLYVTLDGRRVGSGNEYAAKALINPDRTVTLRIVRLVGGAETTVAGPVRVGTLTYSAGAVLDLRVQVTGTAPTQLRARAWADTDPEPGTWSLTAADTTAALQQPGTVGIVAYLSSAATNAPVTVTLRRFVGQPTTAANQPPSASFTASCAQLSCSFDGRASTDPDGTVAGWAWDFGDGATGTGATVAHAYAVAGTYTVTLTVTDGQGATGVATHSVTPTPPPVNQPPTAAFTVSCASLTCTVDGTTSSDDEGVQSWTWDFGDSTSGTGATTAHTYAAAGTYPITLTVADEDGQTGTVTQAVTVTAADPSFVIDNFARTVASGLGQADVGGTWSIAGTPSWFSVSNGTATARLPNPGNQVSGWLPSAARTDTDLQTSFAVTALPTGGPVYVTIEGRRVSSGNEYSAKLLVNANRTVSLFLIRVVGGTETTISPVVVLPGITYAAGQRIGVHLQVVGTGTTTVRARAWAASGAEPSTWTVSATDSTAALQSPGAVGMIAYLSRAITNAPMSVSFGPISARPTGA
ncbi:MAG: PKD domain-containing protein [Jatrophihabitans sp.]|uniref:PKD domain-containing protein n=1 Tax=Jatrophihabitans sp. TaxID=1932789 RepID=UPI003F7EC751